MTGNCLLVPAEGGDPATFARKTLDSRLRGNDGESYVVLAQAGTHTWSPPFGQALNRRWREGCDCSHTSGLCRGRGWPLTLMEYADWSLISDAHSKCSGSHRFIQSRSDQSCHHVMTP